MVYLFFLIGQKIKELFRLEAQVWPTCAHAQDNKGWLEDKFHQLCIIFIAESKITLHQLV